MTAPPTHPHHLGFEQQGAALLQLRVLLPDEALLEEGRRRAAGSLGGGRASGLVQGHRPFPGPALASRSMLGGWDGPWTAPREGLERLKRRAGPCGAGAATCEDGGRKTARNSRLASL